LNMSISVRLGRDRSGCGDGAASERCGPNRNAE
jgi:hypothetical protein